VRGTSTVCRDDRHHDVEVGPREGRGDSSAWETAADGPASDRSPGRVGKGKVKHTTFTIGEIVEEISSPNTGAAMQADLYRRGAITKETAIEWITKAIRVRRGTDASGWRQHAPAVEAALTSPPDCEPGARMNVHRRSEEMRVIPPRSTSTGAATSLSAVKIVTRRRLRREWRYWRCVTRSRPRRFRNGS
jgi:hypothetical protein